jgi:Sugar transferases involved in lipopolysaccharide synthesis
MKLNKICKNKFIYRKYMKRCLDVILAIIAIIILCPVFIILALLIHIKLGSPILFRQKRPGKDEKIFTMYKFRTMTQEKDEKGNLLPDELRLTKFCKLLRSLSLDEIPELFNILHGDMSIVGPRPLPIIYLPFYTEEERRRHTVRPGLTGLAQVNGRNSISWEEKFRYDNRYIQNISFRNDVIIVLLTILKVIKRADIGQAEEAPISLHIQRQNNNKE